MWHIGVVLFSTLAGAACSKKTDAQAIDGAVGITAADYDLPATVDFVKKAQAKNTAELERQLNGPGGPRADIDHDGARDTIKVVEHRAGKKRTLDLIVVPSSTPAVSGTTIAFLDFTPDGDRIDLVARFAPIIIDAPAPITVIVTPVQGTFIYVLVIDVPVIEVEHVHHKHHKW
jgi:hypothetical protein